MSAVAEKTVTTNGRSSTGRKAQDQLLEAQNNNRALIAVVSAIAEATNVNDAIRIALDTIRSSFGWAYGSYWKLDAASNSLKFELQSGSVNQEFQTATENAAFQEGVGLSGRAWRQRDLFFVADIGDMADCCRAPIAQRAGVKSGVCFPIIVDGNVQGTMDFFATETLELSDDRLNTLRSVGRLVSKSIANLTLIHGNQDYVNQLQAISEAQAVIEFETDGTILTANDNFLAVTGYQLDDIQGKHHRIFCDPDYAASGEYKDFWNRLARGESQDGEFKRFSKSGEEVWIQARYSALTNANGETYKVVKYASEITARKKSEAEAAEKAAIVENVPINIMLANTDGQIVYMNPASTKTLKSIESILPIPVEQIVGGSYDVFHKAPAHQRKLLADPKNLPYSTEIGVGEETLQLNASAIYDINGDYAGPMVSWAIITEQKAAAQREKENQERERLAQEELRAKVDQLLAAVNAAADGDLTCEISVTGNDAVGELADGLKRMIGDLQKIISEVVEGSTQFTEGARVVSESAQALAHGAQTQSASVEEMSASIEELTRSIEAVKENAGSADQVAKQTSSLAEEGGGAVQKSVEAMERIKASSSQISEIIQVISEIASQTNLLALNAAIEAARAGEHGMGFAVVADEVRKLAERSSEAAKEISSLIKESTQRVEEGAVLSEQTGAALTKIIQGVEETAGKISEIADATVEQAQNANEVSTAIQSISQVTEQSAAGSEEMASSSEELGAQAASLRELVSRFKLEA